MGGRKIRFPTSIYSIYTKQEKVYTLDSLIEEITDGWNIPKDKDPAQSLYEYLWGYDIQLDGSIGTASLLDNRTEEWLLNYIFYKNCPHEYSRSPIWKEVYRLFEKLLRVNT